MKTTYRVIWEIDMEADSYEDAARDAETIMRRPVDYTDELQARVYRVYPHGQKGETRFIDLANIAED